MSSAPVRGSDGELTGAVGAVVGVGAWAAAARYSEVLDRRPTVIELGEER